MTTFGRSCKASLRHKFRQLSGVLRTRIVDPKLKSLSLNEWR
jgi:hypothetical protein